jgi:hypothetical protein
VNPLFVTDQHQRLTRGVNLISLNLTNAPTKLRIRMTRNRRSTLMQQSNPTLSERGGATSPA